MNAVKYVLPCLLLLFLINCQEKKSVNEATPDETAPEAFIVSDLGDSIAVGLPIAVESHAVALSSLPPPVVTPVIHPRKVASYHNSYAAFEVMTIPVNQQALSAITPGLNGETLSRNMVLNHSKKLVSFELPKALEDLHSQDIATFDIRYLDVSQGLSTSYLGAIEQDKNGYIWFSMAGMGVCRYDGKYNSCFNESDGLISNYIHEIIEDSSHNLWFAGKNGVTKFDGRYFTNYELPQMQTAVLSIFEDNQGTIWWGTTHDGVLRYDPGQDEFRQYQGKDLFPAVTYTITQDKTGNLWFGGAYGAYRYDGEQFINFTKEHGLVYPAVTSMTEDERGRMWMVTPEGLSLYDGSSFHNQVFPADKKKPYFHFVFKDSKGHIWLATQRQGLLRFDGRYYYQYGEREGLRYNEVMEIMEDPGGQIWVTTYGGGLNRLDVSSFRYFSTAEGLHYNLVDDLVVDTADNIWIANGNLIKNDGSSFYYYDHSSGLPSNRIYCLSGDRLNNIWIGTAEGVVKYDGTTFTQYQFNRFFPIQHILPAENGDIWLASQAGVIRLTDTTFTYFGVQEGLPSQYIATLAEDKHGNIWISTARVVSRYDGTNLTHFPLGGNGSEGYDIICSYADEASNIWLGTDRGLYLYREEQFISVFNDEPLLQEAIAGIQEDQKGNIWVNTEKGLLLLEKHENSDYGFRLKEYFNSDYLKMRGLGQAVCLDGDYRLWLGGVDGITLLGLKDFYARRQSTRPTVYLSHLQLNEKYVEFSNRTPEQVGRQFGWGGFSFNMPPPFSSNPTNLIVPHQANHFTFSCTAIDCNTPTRMRYQYQLQGLDENWSQVTAEHKVDYRNIPPGTYSFKVRAGSEVDRWSEPVTYTFTVRPPWWLSVWAYIGYSLLLCLLTYACFLFLKKRLQLQNQLKYEQAEAQRLKELDTFKTRLYTNLTHEFRTPLTVILGMVEQMREAPMRYFAEGTQLIERNGHNLLRLIDQLLDLSKLENKAMQLQLQQGDIVNYLHYLVESFQTYANHRNLTLRFYATADTQTMDYDPEQIKQIMSNLISNALKFTPAGGCIRVKLSIRQRDVIIRVEDTGIGIAEKHLPRIFDRFYQVDNTSTRKEQGTGIGLAHTRELLRLMNGTIRVVSQENQGTTMIITLPIIRNISKRPDQPEANLPPEVLDMSQVENEFPEVPASGREHRELPHLLIIEDNQDVVVYLKNCLEQQYDIAVAYDGSTGIAQALQHIPDLIISDVMMPEKNGYEVCETLKNDERTSHIPIILLTARADVPSRIDGLRRGADTYLSKPFHKEELLVRLHMLVEKQQKLAAYFRRKLQASESDTAVSAALEEEAHDIENAFLQKLKAILEANYEDNQFGLSELCREVDMSRSQLFRKMKALFQQAPSDFIRSFRLRKAKYLLENTDLNVNEVTWASGFTNPTHFSRIFKDEFGVPPSDFNK